MFKYFFSTGNNFNLSLLEFLKIFSNKNNQILIVKNIILSNENINLEKFNTLGGFIKAGKIINKIDNNDHHLLSQIIIKKIEEFVKNNKTLLRGRKIKFSFSIFENKEIEAKKLGMEIKKKLKENNINSRWVISKNEKISSVIIKTNKLIPPFGFDFNIINHEKYIYITLTEKIQNFQEFSLRDYGRPKRDAYSGMLPPKLARMLINISQAKKNDKLLDPFCGSGTILTEANFLGFKNITGTDISQKAIDDTKENLKWTRNKFNLKSSNIKVELANAQNLNQKFKKNYFDYIITEPYLGPQRKLTIHNISKTIKELEKLYSNFLKSAFQITTLNSKIVMVWPIFNFSEKKIFINPDLFRWQYNHEDQSFLKKLNIPLSYRNTIIYKREKQKIFREIIILSKKYENNK